MHRAVLLVLTVTLGLAVAPATRGTAHAQFAAEAELVQQLAGRIVDRTRRAIAIGPFVGGVGGAALSPNQAVGGVSFGLGLYTFEVPSVLSLRELVRARLEARVRERVAQIVAEGGASPADLEAVARAVARDLQQELAGELLAPRLLERPGVSVLLEGVALLEPGAWQLRLGASYGLRMISLGFAGGAQFADGTTSVLAGAEASLRLTPAGRVRTPVLDVFARFDMLFDSGARTGMILGGVRTVLDLL